MSNRKKMWFACGYEQCSRVFKSEGLLERHFSTHQTYTRKIVNSDRRHKCELCPASFEQSGSLIAHIYTHTGQKPFVCDYQGCMQKFTQKAALQRHTKFLHEKPNSFKCHQCPKTFNMKGSLIQHVRMHTGEKPYACEYCHFKCSSRSTLSLHARNRHKEEKEKASHISHPKSKNIVITEKIMIKLTPLSKAELSKLMTVRTNPVSIDQEKLSNKVSKKMFPCTKCKKTFTSYQKMGGHMKIHRQLKFQQRQSNVKQPVKLKPREPIKPKLVKQEKLKVEPNEPVKLTVNVVESVKAKAKPKWEEPTKPFPCTHCEMSYSFQSYLDLHMMSHRNTETPMQIEDSKNALEIDEDSYSYVSGGDLQETGSDDFDFESRVSDIESADPALDNMCDDVLTKELYWPTDCDETENPETVSIKQVAKSSKENDVLQFINNSNVISESRSSDEKSHMNSNYESSTEQTTLLIKENDFKDEKNSDMNDDSIFSEENENIILKEKGSDFKNVNENTPLKRNESIPLQDYEKVTLQNDANIPLNEAEDIGLKENENICLAKDEDIQFIDNENILKEPKKTMDASDINIIVANPDKILSTEDLSQKNEVNDDSFTIIDDNNDFHKAIVAIKIEPKINDFTCKECGKKSRDQYLLFRHMQTQHNNGKDPESSFRGVKRKENDGRMKNSKKKSSTCELNTFVEVKVDEDIPFIDKKIEEMDPLTLVEERGDTSQDISTSQKKQLQQSVNKTETVGKPYACSCKKKFLRENTLHKHLAEKIDALPIHFQLNTSNNQSSIMTENDDLLQDSQKAENLRDSGSFSCGLCKKEYSSYDILVSHIKRIHRKGAKATTDFIINRLIRRPDKVKSFRCPFCLTNFTRYGNLMRHMKSIHGSPVKKDGIANVQEKTAEKLKTKLSETGKELFPSEENLIFAKKSELSFTNSPQSTEIISSGWSESEDNFSGVGEKNYESSSSKASFGESSKSIESNFPQKTSFFLNRINLSEARDGIRKNRNSCSLCPKVYVSTHHLDLHMRLKHERENIAKVKEDNNPNVIVDKEILEKIQNGTVKRIRKKKKRNWNVKKNIHKNKLNYQVKKDTEEYKDNEMIKMKIRRRVKSNKTLICPYSPCNRKFSSQITLNYHMLIHSDVQAMKESKELQIRNQLEPKKDFVCTLCGNKYANQFSLDRHMSNKRIHLPGYPLKRLSGYKRSRKTGKNLHFKGTVNMANNTAKLRKQVQPNTFKMKRLAAGAHGTSKQKKFPQRNHYNSNKGLSSIPYRGSAKLNKLADELCIPCSVYLEPSLIVLE